MLTAKMLHDRQTLPLEAKIARSHRVIKDWYDAYHGDIYVSYSGGKDSTVLVDLVRTAPGVWDVPVVFCDTGLEYPEVRDLATTHSDVVLRPKMTFKSVIEKYGYPCVSKEQSSFIREYRHTKSDKLRALRLHGRPTGFGKISTRWLPLVNAPFEVSEKCCNVMKKRPFDEYAKSTGRNPMTGMMASESVRREKNYMQFGCNAFDQKHPKSMPMGFWTEQDVLRYIKDRGLEYATVYGSIVEGCDGRLHTTGETRTGCMFCMFGVHLEQEPNRFQRMQKTHPKQYAYCMDQLGLRKVLQYMNVPYEYNPTLFDNEYHWY